MGEGDADEGTNFGSGLGGLDGVNLMCGSAFGAWMFMPPSVYWNYVCDTHQNLVGFISQSVSSYKSWNILFMEISFYFESATISIWSKCDHG